MYKVGTLNIHEFTDSNNEFSMDKLSTLLKKVDLDIIALQEVDNLNNLQELVKELKYYNYIFNRHCAILSKLPIKSLIIKKTKERFIKGCITLPNNNNITVINVHLNYMWETIRINEINNILKTNLNTPTILLGDFNSLTGKDYSVKEWKYIYKIRENNKWELPISDLTTLISNRFFDTRWLTKNIFGEVGTCRFDTRIDYIFINKYLKNNILKVEHVKAIPDISDHDLVVCSLKY